MSARLPLRHRCFRLRPWQLLLGMLLMHAMPLDGAPVLEQVPWIGAAHADDDDDGDDDGDDDDDGGGASGAGAASADAGGVADAGQDSDPGRREPSLPVQADHFVVNELIAVNPSAAALQRAQQWGARVIDSRTQAGLGLRVVRLRLPPGLDARSALAVANERDPGVFDLHHLYTLAQADGPGCGAAGCEGERRLDWPRDAAQCGRGQRLGIVDSGVEPSLPALRGADLRTRRFAGDAGAPVDTAHGTAVASILVGQPGSSSPGLVPLASLRAADPFLRRPSGVLAADALGLVNSLDWLVAERVQVIGMSLAGPPNLALQAAVHRAQARGVLVVAAVGNAGRHAPPAHPAALDGVLGATALSADRRVYWRAQQGDAVDFALPGVELPLPDGEGTVRPRSGTSYAVPFLLAKLSQSVHEGALSHADWQAGPRVPVRDLGASGRDPVFGWGLPQVRVRCD